MSSRISIPDRPEIPDNDLSAQAEADKAAAQAEFQSKIRQIDQSLQSDINALNAEYSKRISEWEEQMRNALERAYATGKTNDQKNSVWLQVYAVMSSGGGETIEKIESFYSLLMEQMK